MYLDLSRKFKLNRSESLSISTALFDLDDTLIDSSIAIDNAIDLVFKSVGIQHISGSQFYDLLDQGFLQIFLLFLSPDLLFDHTKKKFHTNHILVSNTHMH